MATCRGGEVELAKSVARIIASYLWAQRELFIPKVFSPSGAVAEAIKMASEEGPVVLHETNDNCGCGSPGDGTWLLNALLGANAGNRFGKHKVAFGFICDGAAVRQAIDVGVGQVCQVDLGGKHGEMHGRTLHVKAYVKAITDGRFILRKYAPGLQLNLGPTVLLEIEHVDVIVTTGREQTFDPVVFEMHGIDVTQCKIIALKSSIHFRAGFRELPNGYHPMIITSDAPGITSNKMEAFEHTNNTSKLWPIHGGACYSVKLDSSL